jgi:hypothetical protein
MDANSKANEQEKGEASIESRQHHHAGMDRNAQMASERYHHIAKWISGYPRAAVFQYSRPNKVKAREY